MKSNSNSNFNIYKTNYDIFYIQIFIKAGAINQNPNEIGLAHYLEHLFSFYTSEKFPNALENQHVFNTLGIDSNAWTDDDHTGYYLKGLNKYWKLILDYVLNAISNFKIDYNVTENEKNSVIRELSRYVEDPYYKLNTKVDEVLYNGTSLAYSIDQEMKNVKENKNVLELTYNFYKKFYKNPCISIICKNKSEIEKYLKLNSNNQTNDDINSNTKLIISNPLKKDIYFVKIEDLNEYKIMFVFPVNITWFDLTESIILDYISRILTGGLSSRLYKILRSELGIVYNISSELNLNKVNRNHSYFCIETMTNKDNVIPVINVIKDNVNNFKNISESEYTQLNNEIELKHNELIESNDFMKEFDEKNTFNIYNRKVITINENYKKQKEVLKSLNNYVKSFIEKHLKYNYYTFCGGKLKL